MSIEYGKGDSDSGKIEDWYGIEMSEIECPSGCGAKATVAQNKATKDVNGGEGIIAYYFTVINCNNCGYNDEFEVSAN